MFSERITNLFLNPQNVGILQNASGVGTFTDEKTNDIFKIYIKVENNIIIDASFKAFTGVVGTAVSSVLTSFVKNKSLDDALKFEEKELINEVGSHIAEYDNYVVVDAIDALKLAISDYQKKLEKENQKKLKK